MKKIKDRKKILKRVMEIMLRNKYQTKKVAMLCLVTIMAFAFVSSVKNVGVYATESETTAENSANESTTKATKSTSVTETTTKSKTETTTKAKTETTKSETTTKSKTETTTTETTETTKTVKAATKPKNVKTKSLTTHGEIKVTWAKSQNAKGYYVYRSTKKDGKYKKIAKVTNRKYVDSKVKAGKSYYYKIVAYNKEGKKSKDSKIVKGVLLKKTSINSISNTSGSRKLVIKWKKVNGAYKYEIARSTSEYGKYKVIATVSGKKNKYTDKKRVGGKTYYYKVRAIDKNGGKAKYSKVVSQMAIDADKKMIALTYDDGPSPYTPIVLDAVEKYDVHVTFFVVGSRLNTYASTLKREVADGCEVGNHTYNHTILSSASVDTIKSEVSKTNQLIKKITGVNCVVMRPPGGGTNDTVKANVNMPMIIWSVDTLDWKTRNTSKTISASLSGATDGGVILMHDLHESTALGAEQIIKTLKSRGYQLVTVSEMAAYRGGMSGHTLYYNFK